MDVREKLPAKLKNRLDSLGPYVESLISTIEDRRGVPKKVRLPIKERRDITFLVFIFSLRRFLEEGSKAAEVATREMVELGLPGFSVGEQIFEPGNENVRRGAILAEGLWSHIADERIRNLLDSENTIKRLVEKLYAITKQPEELDRYRKPQKRPE